MKWTNWARSQAALAAVCVLFPLFPVSGQILEIKGQPLGIRCDEGGAFGVERRDVSPAIPQHYAGRSSGMVLFLDGTNAAMRWGAGTGTMALWDKEAANRLTPVSHAQSDPWRIDTTLDAGTTGVRVEQGIAYADGEEFYTIEWTIRNEGAQTFSDVRFARAADASPGGEDFAMGGWDAGSNMVTAVATSLPARTFMGFQGVTVPSARMAGHFQLVREACKAGELDHTTGGASEQDLAYALLWTRPTLTPGSTWRITAIERWAGGGEPPVEVFTNVTPILATPLTSAWTLNRQTGTYFGNVTIRLSGAQTCAQPFWLAIANTADMRFMHPTDALPDGRQAIDISDAVRAAVGERLEPGEEATISGIEVYMKYRQPPPDSAFSVWATTQP